MPTMIFIDSFLGINISKTLPSGTAPVCMKNTALGHMSEDK